MKQDLLENFNTQNVERIPPKAMAPIRQYILFERFMENFGSLSSSFVKMIGIYTNRAVIPVI